MIKVQPYQSVCLLRSCGTDGSRERFVRVLYGKVCSEAVRHENHAGLKLLSLRQKQRLSPGSYGISYKPWTWQRQPERKSCDTVRKSRLFACALPWWEQPEQYRRRRLTELLRW